MMYLTFTVLDNYSINYPFYVYELKDFDFFNEERYNLRNAWINNLWDTLKEALNLFGFHFVINR